MARDNRIRLKKVERAAEQVLSDMGILELPVDPFKIAADTDINVQAMPASSKSVSGMLLRYGDDFGIGYATHINNKGFIRFSVGHELGHYFIEGHCDHIPFDNNGIHSSRAGFNSSDIYELEADHFAAGLLMPSESVRKIIRRSTDGLATIQAIETDCEVSLTASAIRYAELTDTPVAVIVTKNKKVDYAFLSKGAKVFPEITWPNKGSAIPDGTETALFWEKNDNIVSRKQSDTNIDLMDWLGGKRSVEAYEEVVGLGSYGKSITVLTWPDIEELDEKAEEEEDIIDRWTPRFHK